MPEILSVVLPALDEADGIVDAIEDAEASLDALVARDVIAGYELLVVDDGSADGTGEIVARRAAADPAIRPLAHAVNRGVGAALRAALAAATGPLVLYTDADMPVDLSVLERAIPLLGEPGTGLVAGRRRSYGAEAGVRAILSKAYDAMAHLVLGVPEADVNFPFKLLSLETARRLQLRSDSALVDVEILAAVHALGLRVEQVVLDYRPRQAGESKTMTVPVLRGLATELVRHGGSVRRRRSP